MFNIYNVDYAIGILFMFKKVSNTKLKMKCPIIFADKFISLSILFSLWGMIIWFIKASQIAQLSGMPLVQHLAKAATWHSTIALDNQGQCVIWLTDDYTCHVMPYFAPICPRQQQF